MFNEYPDIVDVEALCKMLQIGKNKAYELLLNSTIESLKISKVYEIPKVNIINYILSSIN